MTQYATTQYPTKAASAVTVNAPGRLHLGFLDPGASLGRRFGSLGLVIDGISTTLEMRLARSHNPGDNNESDSDHYAAPPYASEELPRLRAHIEALKRLSGRRESLDVRLRHVLPVHAGLGSGTQLALCAGHAFARLHRLELDATQLALALARGARSGVGVAGFEQGGLILDGGPRSATELPPVLSRLAFPDEWRVLLVLDDARSGLSGPAERQAMAALPPFPQELAAHACHLALMQILPAAAEHDFAPFARGVSELQERIGRYFAPSQGGIYTSAAVARVLDWIGARHRAGIGQSSWGPTGFAILASHDEAAHAVAAAREAGVVGPTLRLEIVKGRNAGATVIHAPGNA
ncbi:beta-ribofuranosylaminobenzene 5'-phosphate synthase family protein [Paraburkholderia tagetis]|uniref:Beta-ribofuranosylaminobenzene 5'-phosphate synthase n=1 Tax=Paraburkholderia tagetis TaxID=2913261 RepID=A0A9X1RTB4_9BURK|nr:beta-ribofuranosylaminobenzene 5'-phosphate synthase family protein [Paraburkholderia tagetis]MCG5076094.1 beta-ribofuranosylaminobenzene 5'-phosphate synthase [Paraburkholderia tagetis]